MKPASLSFLDPPAQHVWRGIARKCQSSPITPLRVSADRQRPSSRCTPPPSWRRLPACCGIWTSLSSSSAAAPTFSSRDRGYQGVVLVNRTRNIKVDAHHEPPTVWAESGANLGMIARQVALRGLSGLEWAATVPGSLGGAVYGNAGAHGGDIAGNFALADILHRTRGREVWTVEQMQYAYRSSALKRSPGEVVLLGAGSSWNSAPPSRCRLGWMSSPLSRKRTQPPGASMGSMFKNPPGTTPGA